MVKSEELIAAGACLSIKEKLKDESIVDSISARSYRHSALGDRPVVRLTADSLAEGDDLTMEFLGFGKPEIEGPIAKRQRQALGFPGWAIINDPQHARYALELVKEFKHAVRRSKAKPGFGYDEFTDISKRLGKSVAHFLPSFWEQAGREFIALDNATYASRCFGKAREAENVHALKVDESLRQEAFLEFALAGAVSIKALTEYGKELSSTHDPKAAWKFFRELSVRRTLGGMPPWTSMVKDMQPLIKAAGLNPEAEIQSILLEIIDSPAISRAAMGFWESVSKPIAPLVKQDPHLAGFLLNMIPQTSSWRTEDIWPWLEHLEAWGILSNAWKEDVPEAARPTGGPAAWLTRLMRTFNRPRQIIYDILEAMAERLRKDSVAVDLYLKHRWHSQLHADVDLIDLALELKVPFLEVPGDLNFDLRQWAEPDNTDKKVRNRPRDPVLLIAQPQFKTALRTAVEHAAGEYSFEAAATGKVALREARREWLSSLVDGLTQGGLPQVEASLLVLESKTRPAIFQEFPDAFKALKVADARRAITRTIRGGLMDEYGWPAAERVYDSFVVANKAPPSVFGHFPYVILTDRQRVVVVKDQDVVHEAELRLPKAHELKCLRYIDGDLLVWSGANYSISCFWNSDPKPSDPEYNFFAPEFTGVTIDAPGGGTFLGEKIVHRGAKGVSNLRALSTVVCDGTHWWIQYADYDSVTRRHHFSLHEIDPVTGKRGRKSLPSFFEDFVQDQANLLVNVSCLMPVGSSFPASPLGIREGMIGYRLRYDSNGVRRTEGIDGRAFETSNTQTFEYLLDQPGTDARLPVETVKKYNNPIGFKLWDPTGSYELANVSEGGSHSRGLLIGVSALFLHAFQVRDLAASKKLRAISDDSVNRLIQAEQEDFENFSNGAPTEQSNVGTGIVRPKTGLAAVLPTTNLRDENLHSPVLDAAIRTELGQGVNPRLLIGLRGLIIRAGQKIRQLQKLVEKRSAAPAEEVAVTDVATADAEAAQFLSQVMSGYQYHFRSLTRLSFMQCVADVTKFFQGETSHVNFPQDWAPHLRLLSLGLAQAIWKMYCVDPANPQHWSPFALSWSQLPYFRLPGKFRLFSSSVRDTSLFQTERAALASAAAENGYGQYQQWAIPYVGKSSRYLLQCNYNAYEVLEYSPTGNFESIPELPEFRRSETVAPPSVWTSEQVRQFVDLAKQNTVPLPPVDLLKSLAGDLKVSPAEAALVWLGLPGIDAYTVNFMPTHLREGCKLKAKECTVAKEALKELPPNTLNTLVRAVVSGDPADLWEKPPTKVADRIRAAWQVDQPAHIQLDADLKKTLTESFGYGFESREFFQALNAPLAHALFSDRGVWKFGRAKNTAELMCQNEHGHFNEKILKAASNCICILADGLPVGDPARAKLGELHQATLKALANPELLLYAGYRYEMNETTGAKLIELMESVVGKRQQTGDLLDVSDDGQIVVARDDHRLQIAFRPAQVVKAAAFERLSNQLNALQSSKNPDGILKSDALKSLELLRSSGFQAIIDRIRQTPVSAGSYENNPLHSARELVQQVAQKWKLSDDAATYYLQLLALADPTDKNIALWNGWTTATIKQLGSELIDKRLILNATRARAGRKHFLPGGWEDLKAPHLPLESWKIPLFQLTRDAYQRVTPPLARIVPLEPFHLLFAKAWKRIVDGDVPQYEEVE